MARHEFRDQVSPEGLTLSETVVKINRCAAVVKGGRLLYQLAGNLVEIKREAIRPE